MTFYQQFIARLDALEARAERLGVPFSDLTAAVGASRYTPVRWRKKPPYTVDLIDKMEAVLAAREEQGKQNEQ